MSGGEVRGVAWKAHLYHQGAGSQLRGLPLNLADLFQPAYDAGARIHSNSWGGEGFGFYYGDEYYMDLFVWNHQDFLPVFPVGNSANDGQSYSQKIMAFMTTNPVVISAGVTFDPADFAADGRVDPGSVICPATAKNILSVGGSENNRLSGEGSASTYGGSFGGQFKNAPINSDLLASGIVDTGGVYRVGAAAFSGRGPTIDGRIKPDLLTPATAVASTRSSLTGSSGGSYLGNSAYRYSNGTSFAAPLAAGCAALVREHIIKREGIAEPTAALVRAALINGAESLAPGQYGTGFYQEIPLVSPNNAEGWGRLNLADTLYPRGSGVAFFDRINDGRMTDDDFWSEDFQITETNTPLKITLAWADYPDHSALPLPGQLVNDYDLYVVNLNNTSENYYGNGVINGDATNNAERVVIRSPHPATYRAYVIAARILVPYRKIGSKVVSPGSIPALVATGGFANTFAAPPPQSVPPSLATDYTGGATNLRVKAIGAWRIASTNDWISPAFYDGFGTDIAPLHIATNYAAASRSADLWLSAHTATNPIPVHQTAWDKTADPFAMETFAFSFDDGAGDITVRLSGERNMRYILQQSTNLADAVWCDIEFVDTSAPAPVLLNHSVSVSPPQSFFRIKALPLAE